MRYCIRDAGKDFGLKTSSSLRLLALSEGRPPATASRLGILFDIEKECRRKLKSLVNIMKIKRFLRVKNEEINIVASNYRPEIGTDCAREIKQNDYTEQANRLKVQNTWQFHIPINSQTDRTE